MTGIRAGGRCRKGAVGALAWLMLALAHGGAPVLADAPAAPPQQLVAADLAQPGRAIPIQASACNRAISLHVSGAALYDTYGDHPPPPGHRWLVLDVRMENWMPVDLILAKGYQEALLIAAVKRQLYLLVNGERVYRAAAVGEGLLEEGFVLPQIGTGREGRVVYPVPAQGVRALSLRYYHDEYAPLILPLMGEEAADTAPPEAVADAVQVNNLMEIAVHEAAFHDRWQDRAAPPGMQWLVADIRGRSRWTIQADAVALDASAPRDARVDLPKVMEYMEAEGLLQVVVDGEHAYVRDFALSTIPRDPAFLPDAWAGGVAVFPVPQDAGLVELVTHFPLFRGQGMESQTPDPMRFAVREGTPPPASGAEPVAKIEDRPTPFTLHAMSRVERFAEHAAEPGETLLLLDASMRNISDTGGMMQVTHRVRLSFGEGDAIEPAAVYQRGPLELVQPFWLPAGGEPRRFRLLYRIPDDSMSSLQLRYGGVSVNERLELPLPAAAQP